MLNLALRSCGFYINSTKHSKNTWGSSFFGEGSQSCDSKHDTLFGCTNTTFTDQNGEPEGDVVFVNTNCTSNERLEQGQDPRYYSEVTVESIFLHQGESPSVSISEFQPFPPKFRRQDPVGDETCFRACLCGYTIKWFGSADVIPSTSLAPYQVCNCPQILGDYYSIASVDGADKIYLTSANTTLLKYYGVLPCDARVRQSGSFSETFHSGLLDPDDTSYARWLWVSDNDLMTVPVGGGGPYNLTDNTNLGDFVTKNDYECFDNFDNMQLVIDNYINQSYRGVFDLESTGACNYPTR